jgi:hypothetical protein
LGARTNRLDSADANANAHPDRYAHPNQYVNSDSDHDPHPDLNAEPKRDDYPLAGSQRHRQPRDKDRVAGAKRDTSRQAIAHRDAATVRDSNLNSHATRSLFDFDCCPVKSAREHE